MTRRAPRALLAMILAAAAAAPATSNAAGNNTGKGADVITTELELTIESVMSIGAYAGEVKVAAPDPRFVLTGTVTWVERPNVIPADSQQAFAIHSPAKLLLIDWKAGDRACFKLTRRREAGRTSWLLMRALGEQACHRRRSA